MSRRLLTVSAALLLIVGTACGSDSETSTEEAASEETSSETLTKEEFIGQGDVLCLALSQAQEQIEPPVDESDFARFIAEAVGQAEEASRQFGELVPPADGEDVHAAMLDALNTSIETAKGAIAAAQSGDTVTAGDLLTQAGEEGDAADEEAREYGFTECGKEDVDAAPSGAESAETGTEETGTEG